MLNVAGGKLAYDLAGEGPPIVLLHEGIADRRMWDREFGALSAHHRTVRYDYRGFGGSPPATAKFSNVDDLQAVIRDLHLEHPVLVAPSIGGRIAIDFALAHPGVAAGLFLVAPGLSGMELEYDPEGREAFEIDERESTAVATAWKAGRRADAEELLRKLWASALTGPALDRFRTMVRENATEVFEDRSAQFDTLAGPPAAKRLDQLSLPVQVVYGDKDNPSSPRFSGYIARSVPGAELLVVHGGDHVLNLSAPGAFDAALSKFLQRVASRKG